MLKTMAKAWLESHGAGADTDDLLDSARSLMQGLTRLAPMAKSASSWLEFDWPDGDSDEQIEAARCLCEWLAKTSLVDGYTLEQIQHALWAFLDNEADKNARDGLAYQVADAIEEKLRRSGMSAVQELDDFESALLVRLLQAEFAQ